MKSLKKIRKAINISTCRLSLFIVIPGLSYQTIVISAPQIISWKTVPHKVVPPSFLWLGSPCREYQLRSQLLRLDFRFPFPLYMYSVCGSIYRIATDRMSVQRHYPDAGDAMG